MDIFIVDISCWLIWVTLALHGFEERRRCSVTSLATTPTTKRELAESGLLEQPILATQPKPLHILVPSRSARFRSSDVVPHVWAGPLPTSECFRRLAPHVYVATVEFCFLLLASYLPQWRLIAFGYELCGGYYLLPDQGHKGTDRQDPDADGFDYCVPVTDVGRLRAFVERCKGMPGYTQASKALDWVLEGSRSPRETALTMLLCLSAALGGYALPLPYLNRKVNLSPRGTRLAGVDWLIPDLCWPDFKVVSNTTATSTTQGTRNVASAQPCAPRPLKPAAGVSSQSHRT